MNNPHTEEMKNKLTEITPEELKKLKEENPGVDIQELFNESAKKSHVGRAFGSGVIVSEEMNTGCCEKCVIYNSPSRKDYPMACSNKSCPCHQKSMNTEAELSLRDEFLLRFATSESLGMRMKDLDAEYIADFWLSKRKEELESIKREIEKEFKELQYSENPDFSSMRYHDDTVYNLGVLRCLSLLNKHISNK